MCQGNGSLTPVGNSMTTFLSAGHSSQRLDRSAARTPLATVAGELQALFGQKLTGAMVGVHARTVGAWLRGEQAPTLTAEQRLRNLYLVARFLQQYEGEETVRSWFLGMCPELGDYAPAELIGEAPARVLAAARAFVADS